MKKGLYYFTREFLFEILNRQLNLLIHEDQYLSLAKITSSSDLSLIVSSSSRMCCCSMFC